LFYNLYSNTSQFNSAIKSILQKTYHCIIVLYLILEKCANIMLYPQILFCVNLSFSRGTCIFHFNCAGSKISKFNLQHHSEIGKGPIHKATESEPQITNVLLLLGTAAADCVTIWQLHFGGS
jgi:hypothetical protein